jgi:hypothetical protein
MSEIFEIGYKPYCAFGDEGKEYITNLRRISAENEAAAILIYQNQTGLSDNSWGLIVSVLKQGDGWTRCYPFPDGPKKSSLVRSR